MSAKSALNQFSGQVEALQNQSGPAYRQINQLFGQMQTAASGGTAGITLAQAEAAINSVVSNRTSLAAAARTLGAPTPLAATVRSALVAALDASLTNDQDINNCLNQANKRNCRAHLPELSQLDCRQQQRCDRGQAALLRPLRPAGP